MATSRTHLSRRLVTLAALVLGSTILPALDIPQASTAAPLTEPVSRIDLTAKRTAARKSAPQPPHTYRWPVKPFDRQHPVRGFFGDPRAGKHGARQFHFGIDISAPNGTPVYATVSGTVTIHPLHATTIVIVGRDGVEFSYWHVVPVVRSGQHATAYRTVIGHIEEPYGHVHFSERRGDRYLNPLRPGALGPYVDATRPRIASVKARSSALVAEIYDETPLAVPRPWHDLPVVPALVRWRVLDDNGHSVLGWWTAVDFRETIPPASAFFEIWAPGTMQNHVRAPGSYRLVLTGDLDLLPARAALVEVAARDTRGNATLARFPLGLSGS